MIPPGDFALENELSPHLDADEKLHWVAKPRTGIRFRTSDLFMIPFSIIWCGFAIFWESSVLITGAPLIFKLWGIPFVAIGLYIVFGRFFADSWKRSRTIYGITSRRIVIKTGNSINSWQIKTLPSLSLNEKADGSGSITFYPSDPNLRMLQTMNAFNTKSGNAIEMISNVREVYSLIIKLQSN